MCEIFTHLTDDIQMRLQNSCGRFPQDGVDGYGFGFILKDCWTF